MHTILKSEWVVGRGFDGRDGSALTAYSAVRLSRQSAAIILQPLGGIVSEQMSMRSSPNCESSYKQPV